MIVFFDVDGTIVDDETQILPESAVRAVEQLTQNGHLAVVNTGRPLGNVDYRVRNMAFSGWIAACGMEIMLDGKWLRRDVPDTKLCQFVRECVHRTGMKVMFEAEDALLRDGEHSSARLAEQDFLHLLFEAVSAFATVGLTAGVTPQLCGASRLLLILIMFIGRLGPITVASVWFFRPASPVGYTTEHITIG